MVEVSPNEGFDTAGLGFAGDTYNTAWYLAGQGTEVQFATLVGCDAVSDRFVAQAQAAGIGTTFTLRHPSRTMGLYMIHLSAGERSFSYWRDQAAARLLADDPAALDRAFAATDVIYFTGITLAILGDVGRNRFEAALIRARAKGKRIVFDTNLRPRLWESDDQMCAQIMRFAAVSDLALPSFDDEAEYFGDGDRRATAARYARAGVSLVVVKDGAGDVLCLSDGEETEVAVTSATKVVDTTAAGDSFNAGFLASYLTGAGLAQAVASGADLAKQVIGARGALVLVAKG